MQRYTRKHYDFLLSFELKDTSKLKQMFDKIDEMCDYMIDHGMFYHYECVTEAFTINLLMAR